MSSFSLKGPNGQWADNQNINYMGVDYSPQLILDNNYVFNLREIDSWIKPCQVTLDPVIIVSAGPSCDFDKIKKLMKVHPGAKVLCVKHAYPKLLANGIIPWGCVIVDARMLEGISSWGKKRSNLIETAHPNTTFFIQSQSHPSYVKFLKKQNATIRGFITTASEIYRILGFSQSGGGVGGGGAGSGGGGAGSGGAGAEAGGGGIPKNILEEIEMSSVISSGSCAATCAIPLAHHLGFRKMYLFGYDGNIVDPPVADRHEWCFETRCRGMTYWIPKEFVMMAMEMEQLLRNYPRKYNIDFQVYGNNDSFTYSLYRSILEEGGCSLQKREEMLSNSLVHCKEIKDIVASKKYFNKPFTDPGKILLGYRDYSDYVEIQQEGYRNSAGFVLADRDIMKDVAALIREHHPHPTEIKMGVCHGVRTGHENKWLSEDLGIKVTGTDIAQEAVAVDTSGRTICWDFHDLKDEWIQRLDFIYSNSLNHSYNPRYCLDQWLLSLKPGGLCILEWTEFHHKESVNQYRPFGCSVEEYVKYVQEKYAVKMLIKKDPKPLKDSNNNLSPITAPLERHLIVIQLNIGDKIYLGS